MSRAQRAEGPAGGEGRCRVWRKWLAGGPTPVQTKGLVCIGSPSAQWVVLIGLRQSWESPSEVGL